MNFVAADTSIIADLNTNNNLFHNLRRSPSLLSYRSQEEGKTSKHKWSNPNSRASSADERRTAQEAVNKLKPESSHRQRASSDDSRRVIGQLLGSGRAFDHLLAGIMGEGLQKDDLEMDKIYTDVCEEPSKRVVFNISGKRYETLNSTLDKFPDSLLAMPNRQIFYDPVRQEYFFDRNRKAFSAILTYCQTGVLVKPPTLDERIFAAELRFFGFDEESEMHVVSGPEQPRRLLPKNKYQRKIWQLFEYPDTSTYARVVAIFSVFVIILSITMFCLETLPTFKETHYEINKDANGTVISKTDKGERLKQKYTAFFNTIELICIIWFTVEYCVRLLSCPQKLKFLYQPLNVIDLVAILPFYVTIALNSVDTNVGSLSILRILRLVRVFRIFKLSRYSRGLKILGYTFKVCQLSYLLITSEGNGRELEISETGLLPTPIENHHRSCKQSRKRIFLLFKYCKSPVQLCIYRNLLNAHTLLFRG